MGRVVGVARQEVIDELFAFRGRRRGRQVTRCFGRGGDDADDVEIGAAQERGIVAELRVEFAWRRLPTGGDKAIDRIGRCVLIAGGDGWFWQLLEACFAAFEELFLAADELWLLGRRLAGR